MLEADFVVGGRTRQVWFRTDEGPVSARYDPFVPVALIPAMRRGWALAIDGEVSADLLQGARRVQEIISGWYPEFHQIPIRVAGEAGRPAAAQRSVATFFSGGVDSFYTLQHHLNEITHLIFVHGFDVPLGRTRERERNSASVRSLASLLGLQLVEVETNLRQFGQPHVSWLKAYFGAALAAVALLLAPRFERVFLPASLGADLLEPMGSHPDLDPLWSDGSTQLLHDGLQATRFEKIQSIAQWHPVRSHLRVCYQPSHEEPNCGHCRKCLWTMMALRACGCLDRMSTFPKPLDLAALQRYPPVQKYERDRFEKALAFLEQGNADPELQQVLRAMLDANGRTSLRAEIERAVARARNYLAHRLPPRRRAAE